MAQYRSNQPELNVGQADRMFSLGAGALLTVIGLRRSLPYVVLTAIGGYLLYRGLSGNCKVYEAFDLESTGDILPRGLNASVADALDRPIKIERGVTINRSPAELYLFWRNLENLPRFMQHLQSVTVYDGKTSHWIAKAPMGGMPIEWDAEITDDRPNEYIAWRSLPGSRVTNSGSVRFAPAPGGRGTEVHVQIEYRPPGGVAGAAIARAFNKITAQSLKDDLCHFQEMMEASEVPAVTGQPSGRHATAERAREHARQSESVRPEMQQTPAAERQHDVVHKASEDSFPASDSPSYHGGVD